MIYDFHINAITEFSYSKVLSKSILIILVTILYFRMYDMIEFGDLFI